MEKKHFFNRHQSLTTAISVLASVAAVAGFVYGATTIGTNISVDGTLTVTGLSTMNGQFQASSTALLGGAVTAYGTVLVPSLTVGASAASNSLDGTILFASRATDPVGVTQGTVYYNSTSKVLKLFDGSNWFTTGTTTSGISLSGARLQLADLTTQFLTIGTTTQQGLSMLTVEATSTTAIPLSLVARTSQTADLLDVLNSGGTKLFFITSAGAFSSANASTTILSTTGNFMVNGFATTTATNGNIATQGTLTVTGASTHTGNTTFGSGYTAGSGTGALLTGASGLFQTNGDINVNGNATTSASTGTFTTQGKIGGGGTTTPATEIATTGSGTTTLFLNSTSATQGSCIAMQSPNGTRYAVYVNNAGALTAVAGSCK
ncbi:hypothetical protein KGQ34_02905 [Patescibacteria group bacterium]|nr:hypothetical protein [Patescibacteria group bacterium]